MRIAVCDDNSVDRELIVTLLQKYFSKKDIPCEVVQYDSGVHLINDVEDDIWYDIVFLDIYMGEMLGIDVAGKLRDKKYSGEIIFITASADYAVESYDVSAAGYLLKPYDLDRLCRVLRRIVQDTNPGTYQIRQRSKVIRIPYHEILYVESNNSKCVLHRKSGNTYVVYKRLDEIEEELKDERFLRCHQSYLVNMDYIYQADKQFELISGETVLIRQRDLKAIRQTYLDYLAKQKE